MANSVVVCSFSFCFYSERGFRLRLGELWGNDFHFPEDLWLNVYLVKGNIVWLMTFGIFFCEVALIFKKKQKKMAYCSSSPLWKQRAAVSPGEGLRLRDLAWKQRAVASPGEGSGVA